MKSYIKVRTVDWRIERKEMFEMSLERRQVRRTAVKAYLGSFFQRSNEEENWESRVDSWQGETKGKLKLEILVRRNQEQREWNSDPRTETLKERSRVQWSLQSHRPHQTWILTWGQVWTRPIHVPWVRLNGHVWMKLKPWSLEWEVRAVVKNLNVEDSGAVFWSED